MRGAAEGSRRLDQRGDRIDEPFAVAGVEAALGAELAEFRGERAPQRGVDRGGEMPAPGRVDDKVLAARMSALGDQAHVQQRAAEEDPRQVRIEDRPDLELEAAERLTEDADLREPVRAGERADRAER